MRQGGHGAHPEPAMREAFARASFAGFGTAACDAGWSQSCAVFGLPFDTDTWNSFIQHSLAAKRSVMDFSLFRNFKVTIQIVNSCGESSLLCHLLTLAPRCPVLLPVSAARVVRPPRARVGTNRLTARELPAPYRHPNGQLPSPDKNCSPHADTIGKAFGEFGVPVEPSTSLYSRVPDLASPVMSYSSDIILLPWLRRDVNFTPSVISSSVC